MDNITAEEAKRITKGVYENELKETPERLASWELAVYHIRNAAGQGENRVTVNFSRKKYENICDYLYAKLKTAGFTAYPLAGYCDGPHQKVRVVITWR